MARWVALVVLLGLMVPATAAAAATRYADPAGTAADPCSQAQPCDIVTAINNASAGDTVIVNSGTYGSAGSPLTTKLGTGTNLTIQGAGQGANRPVIYAGGSSSALSVNGSASDLTIDANTGRAAVVLEAGATATRLYISESGAADACQLAGDGATLTDSVCWAHTLGSRSGLATSHAGTLRNDTLIGNAGLFNTGASNVVVVNCILHKLAGANGSFAADYYGFVGGTATFTNVEYQDPQGTAPTDTGRVDQSPQFVDEANGDFHQASGAPSIDTGTDAVANGTNDLDGNLRQVGSHTDIGAYEYVAAPTASATVASSVRHTSLKANGTLDAGGSPASYHFVYGTSSGSLTSSTPTQTLGAATGSQAVSADLTGLAPGMPYFYALVVNTNGGTVTSGAQSASTTSATTRYADPAGSATDPCTQAAPCDIVTAINGADTGDTVIVNSGTYGSASSPLTTALGNLHTPLTIRGAQPGGARPVIYVGGGPGFLTVTGPASDLIIHGAGGQTALYLVDNAVATRVEATESATGQDACEVSGNRVVLTDSICWAQATNRGAAVSDGIGATLRNDTLVGHSGLESDASTTVVNSIISGGHGIPGPRAVDIYIPISVTVFASYDEFQTSGGSGTVSASHQVNQAPAFVDAANGDFHEAAGAPSIDTGTDNSANGSIDIDGESRQLGTHTDIGAYEFLPAPTASVAPATDLSTTGATLHGSLNDAGLAGSYHFLYGTSAGSLTSATPTQSIPAGAASQSVSAPLTGLTPGTTYFYALMVSTTGGTVSSASGSFTTYATTPPSIAITAPADGATYTTGAVVPAAYTCTDRSGAGIASCGGPVASGAAIDTSTPGPHTFTVTATDHARNQATSAVRYTVAPSAPPAGRLAVLAPVAFVAGNGVGGAFLGCLPPAGSDVRPADCARAGMSLVEGRTTVASRRSFVIYGGDAGIVHFTLARAVRRALVRGERPVVTLSVRGADGSVTSEAITLIGFGTVRTARADDPLRLFGGTAFVDAGGRLEAFLGCFTARPCSATLTATAGTAALASARVTVPGQSGVLTAIALSPGARARLASSGHTPSTITLQQGAARSSYRITLESIG